MVKKFHGQVINGNMITKFKIFEKIQVDIDIPEDILNTLTNAMTFLIYKGKKRTPAKNKNFKSLRIKKIDGYYNQSQLHKQDLSEDYLFQLEMTNKDKIEAKYVKRSDVNNMLENSVYVEINGIPVYHLDNKDYDVNSFIEKIKEEYTNHLEKNNWKIR